MTVTELRSHAAHLRAAAEALEAEAVAMENATLQTTVPLTSQECQCLFHGGDSDVIQAMSSDGLCPACGLPRLVLHPRPAAAVASDERIDVCDD